MIPSKNHLQLIVKELEKFNSEIEKSYNFQEFIDRCSAIFDPKSQTELKNKLIDFKQEFLIDTLTAQTHIYNYKIRGLKGNYVLHLKYSNQPNEKIKLNINSVEYRLRGIIIWCRKKIIKLIKDERIEFDKIGDLDVKY